ncbi:hypothetical protein EDD85DRAFT_937717 [Armillaria nabsnona]|nr:hypothetical protein EDD85DRAFT_937717 [Armillaria nabsnona]
MPQNHHDTNKLIYDLTDFSPPQLYLPPSFHTETYKTGWKYLESSRSNSSDSVVPGEQVLFHGLALASSLFHNHVKIVNNKPIHKSYQLPDPLPSGEPVSYQIQMHDRIRLVIIEEEDLQLPDPEVYTRLFTELYGTYFSDSAASQSNKSTVYNFYKRESLDLRVYGLLADGVHNAFFSYNPVTTKFQMDEMVYVKRGCQTAFHDLMRLSEKVFSILMHAYNEFLDHWYKCIASLPQEDLTKIIQSDRTLPSLMEEAIKYANRATAQLGSPKNDDALRRGLDDLHKSVWALPLRGRTNNCWLGLHDDLDHMAAKAVSNFRREQLYVEKQWKDARKYQTHLYCA